MGSQTHSKKQLLRAIRKESKPPKGFGQWIAIIEARRVSEHLGLIRLEWYSNSKLEWSAGLSVNLPQVKVVSPDGKEIAASIEWDKLGPGESTFNVLTCEMRGKSIWEATQGFFRRSLSDARIQDFLPWIKS
jgi:hypothetical protein